MVVETEAKGKVTQKENKDWETEIQVQTSVNFQHVESKNNLKKKKKKKQQLREEEKDEQKKRNV